MLKRRDHHGVVIVLQGQLPMGLLVNNVQMELTACLDGSNAKNVGTALMHLNLVQRDVILA